MIHSQVLNVLMAMIMLVPLFDAFDRIFARTAMRLDGADGPVAWPVNRRIAWGIISNVRIVGTWPQDIRFFYVYLPFRTWGLVSAPWVAPHSAAYGLRRHRLQWIERGSSDNPYLGWRLEPSLPA